MPELPEVETIRLHLIPLITHRTITHITVYEKKQFVGEVETILGREITGLERRGKILIVRLSDEHSFLIHLKMSGQILFFSSEPTLIPKYARIVIKFKDKSALFFCDMRKFGWMKITQNLNFKTQKEIVNLGLEPFDKEFTESYLKQIFSKSFKPIKTLLMDQTKIAGVGNIYANEALFLAGILPIRLAKTLTIEEIKRLRMAVIEVLKNGLKYGGSSAEDEAYIRPDGSRGSYQKHFLVYQKDKKPCPNNCGSQIRRISLGGRGTFFCQKCQS